jgi:hypothetical protein
LSFKKGDIIFVKRRINDDWLEGEHQGVTGIFPRNYVELFPYETDEQDKQQIEGEAIVKYDFIPQETFELQLRKVCERILFKIRIWFFSRVKKSFCYVELMIIGTKDDLTILKGFFLQNMLTH